MLRLLATDLAQREIGAQLSVSFNTGSWVSRAARTRWQECATKGFCRTTQGESGGWVMRRHPGRGDGSNGKILPAQ